MTFRGRSQYLSDMTPDLFDQCENEIHSIPLNIEGESFLTEVADVERRVILETRLAISAIREFPRDLAHRCEVIIREFALIPDARKISKDRDDGFERGDREFNVERAFKASREPRRYALEERRSVVIGLLRHVFADLSRRHIVTKFGELDGDPRHIRRKKARFFEGKKGRR